MGASGGVVRSTPCVGAVLVLAGRLGGLAVVSGMVNPYSYAGQCNKLLVAGLEPSAYPCRGCSSRRCLGPPWGGLSELHQHGWGLRGHKTAVASLSGYSLIPMRISCWHLPAHLKVEHVHQRRAAFAGLPTRLRTEAIDFQGYGAGIVAIPMRVGVGTGSFSKVSRDRKQPVRLLCANAFILT